MFHSKRLRPLARHPWDHAALANLARAANGLRIVPAILLVRPIGIKLNGAAELLRI